MNRKILAVVSTALLLATSARSADPAVRDVEKALDTLNKAFEKRDATAIKNLMTADHVAVTAYYDGAHSRDEQVKTLPDFKYLEYKADKMQVTLLGKDVALVSYILAQKGTYKGKEIPRKAYASAIWVRQAGEWRERFYQETSLDEK